MFRVTKFEEMKVSGRGKVILVHLDDHPEMKECAVGDTLSTPTSTYEVTAIELYFKLVYPPIPGKNRGFIVKEKINGR